MQSLIPQTLHELFAIFDQLEDGSTIALLPPTLRRSRLRSAGYGAAGPRSYALTLRCSTLPRSDSSTPRLGLWSSGSSGKPKLAWHSWPELNERVVRNRRYYGWTWASPFEPHTFAGVHVALQAWASGGRAISVGSNWQEAWANLQREKVDALSCTPTYADLLLQNERARDSRWFPKQLTLGGEALRPRLGERLARRFKSTRFTVFYATSELGVLSKTHRMDGWHEWKSTDLSRRANAQFPQLRIRRGHLEVRRCERWISTGDLGECRGTLFRVVGRGDAVANVAGTKVNLDEIATLAEEVPGIRRAKAVAEPNAISGQVVALRFELEPSAVPHDVQLRLESHLRENLKKEAWPRRWIFDPGLPVINSKR